MKVDKANATDLSGISDAVILLGTNDVQNPGAAGSLDDCIGYMTEIIDILQAAFIRVTFAVFPMWYDKSLTPDDTGVTTFNYDLSMGYRQAYRYLAASEGCRIVDLNQELKGAFAYDLPGGVLQSVTDIGVRDNIHPTAMRYILYANAIARTIAGWWPEKTRVLEPVTLPPSLLKNWTARASLPPKIGISADGRVYLSGAVVAGTKSDGSVVMQLPRNLCPSVPAWFIGRSSFGTLLRLNFGTGGDLVVYDINGDSAGTEVYLDQISWQVG